MKKLLYSLFLVFTIFIGMNYAKANSISDINMDIYIDSNGDAHVVEKWTASLTSGTEGYKPYYNLGSSTIENFSVSDETNTYYNIGSWDTSASFSDKAYKNGINEISDGVELCWGISNYGTHTYTLSYTITNFVAQLSDYQMVYWTLIPYELSSKPDNVYIKIYADNAFSDSLDVWGYGNYGGYAYVYDGYIEMSNDDLDSDEYMTVLIKFDNGTFNTSNILDYDFDYYYNMAEKGASHYKGSSNFIGTIVSIFIMIINLGIWILIFVGISKASKTMNSVGTKKFNFGVAGKKVPKDVPLFRELVCGKDLYRTYWLACNYNLAKKNTDFLGAIILKWLKTGKIKIENKTVGKIFKKEDTTIVFVERGYDFDTQLESQLYDYMVEASKDGILESKEFERWCSTNYNKILKWFDKVADYESDLLTNEGKLVPVEKTTFGIFKSTIYDVDASMMEEAKQLKGLKKFFNEFGNMKDKEAIDVHMWEEYLMYAQILGVADKVAKQFKELYPDVITDYSYESVVFVSTISRSGMVSASNARSRAQSYSSGGGGFSSGGGGGGSFGGGGGGGGFR